MIAMTFENLDRLTNREIAQLGEGFAELAALPDEPMAVLANALVDALFLPELERREAKEPAQTRVVEVIDARLTIQNLRRLLMAGIHARDDLRRAGRLELAGVFDAIVNGAGTEFALMAQEARVEAARAAAEIGELKRLWTLPG